MSKIDLDAIRVRAAICPNLELCADVLALLDEVERLRRIEAGLKIRNQNAGECCLCGTANLNHHAKLCPCHKVGG